MSDSYRLVFRGEVAEGQHPAVVKKRLAKVLKLSGDKVDKLFSGSTVVLRRNVDAKTAARYQSAFKESGAQLRVQPIRDADSEHSAAETDPGKSPTQPSAQKVAEVANQAATASTPASTDPQGLRLLPVGSYLLEVHERLPPVEANIAIDHLSLSEATDANRNSDSALDAAVAVNVDHLSMADPGATLGVEQVAGGATERTFEFEFELAEDGSWLSEDDDSASAPVAAPDYSLAEPGALLSTAEPKPEPSAPDVSHLSLRDDQTSD